MRNKGVFWRLIELHTITGGALDIASFDVAFSNLTAEEQVSAREAFRDALAALDSRLVWTAGSLLAAGPMGDDAFDAFRRAIVALGFDDFERIVRNPDSLPDILSRLDLRLNIDSLWIESLGLIEEGTARPAEEDLHKEQYRIVIGSSLHNEFPQLWSRLGAEFERGLEQVNDLDNAPSVYVDGLGTIAVGDRLRHKGFGNCTVKSIPFAESKIVEADFGYTTKFLCLLPEFFSR